MSTAVKSQGEATTKRAIRSSPGLSDRALQNLFICPTLVLLIAINVFPLIYSLYLSFTDYSAIAKDPPVWVAFDNFAQ